MSPSLQTKKDCWDVIVIGAGMSGIAAARELTKARRRVLILEKGRGVGGRLATRRIGSATFDHGAQFATARDVKFGNFLEEAKRTGVAREWCRGFSEKPDGHARWIGNPGMSALAKHLATGLDVRLEKQVSAIRLLGERVEVQTAEGESFAADSIVLTAPVPQTLALLDAGGVELRHDLRDRLEAITYERCLAVMAVLAGPSRLLLPGAISPTNGPIAWIADNRLKGISTEHAVTIHADHGFSLSHWDSDRIEASRLLVEAAKPWLGQEVTSLQIHGWRYAKPVTVDPDRCLVVHRFPTLIVAGDAFAGPRVEGAALSGWAAAESILKVT